MPIRGGDMGKWIFGVFLNSFVKSVYFIYEYYESFAINIYDECREKLIMIVSIN
jgi:hypothetical protein